MSIALEWEQASVVFDEFQELFDAHYLEIYGKGRKVERDVFTNLEHADMLLFLVARDDGKAVGYYVMSVSFSVYIPSRVEAKELAIYVSPEYRKQGITTAMQDVMDKALKVKGVSDVYVSYPYESTIPTNRGYKMKEVTYMRTI